MFSEIDHVMMATALAVARDQIGRTGANPAVGCVITKPDGVIIAKAATQDGGRPHAEETALAGLEEGAAKGATAYVTLEPCRERSNGSASCSARLIEAGVTRVIYAISDPHPKGEGGADRLREAGVLVEEGLMGDEAAVLYRDFFERVRSASS